MRKFVLKKIITLFVFSFLAGGWFIFILYGRLPLSKKYDILKEPQKIIYKSNNFINNSDSKEVTKPPQNNITKTPTVTVTKTPTETPVADKDVFLTVPFAAQAPLGNWADPMQQNGCEEVSAIMAMAWVEGKEKLAPEDVINEIRKISNYELEKYGGYIDTSAEDTVLRIFKGYYKYENVEVRYNINKEDIKQELFKGNLVIVPANGRKLANPNYTPPGPETHMLPIIGYDAAKKEFITNDGGTRKGAGFRFKEDVVEEAIVDYPTGNHEEVMEIRKAMIVVKK